MEKENIANWDINLDKYSPSNIETKYGLHYYNKLEYDWCLCLFIEIFKENWNNWEMDNQKFESIIDKKWIIRDSLIWYKIIYEEVLEVNWNKIRLYPSIMEYLLKYGKKPSILNAVKQFKKTIQNLI